MNIIGVDPGISGAIALLSPMGELTVIDMPVVSVVRNNKAKQEVSPEGIKSAFWSYIPGTAYIEKVGAMPGQGVSSMFGFGMSAGLVRGVLAGLGWKIELVPPQTWKKHFGLIGSEKGQSLLKASDIFPNYDRLFTRLKDTGRSDAALIAAYGAARQQSDEPN